MQSDQTTYHHYRLITTFGSDYVEHPILPRPASDTERNPAHYDRWRSSRELGRGGFGVVHMQTEVSSGRLRAVKTITKAQIPPGLDVRRELGVMAILTKVRFWEGAREREREGFGMQRQ